MACIIELKNKDGSKRYQIVWREDGKTRKYLSLPAVYKKRDVENLRRIVESLVDSIKTESPIDVKTIKQIQLLSRPLQAKLEHANLIRIKRPPTIRDVLNAFWNAPKTRQLKPSSQANYECIIRTFLNYYSETLLVSDLTQEEIQKFKDNLNTKYAKASIAGIFKSLKSIFSVAVESNLISTNPFPTIPKSEFKNKSREVYIDMETYHTVLESCQDVETRAAFAFYRIGGIRRGEIEPLQWKDIDWKKGRVVIHAPKLDRYTDKGERVIPLFPALRSPLEALWNVRKGIDKESDRIFQHGARHYSTAIKSAVKRSGVPIWERLIQNLRSSRACEIEEQFGTLAENQWIGHSTKTAIDHYLHVLDATFEKALNCEN